MNGKYKIFFAVLALIIIVPCLTVVLSVNTAQGCIDCNGSCDYLNNATQVTQQYQELNNGAKAYVAEKENISANSIPNTIIKHKATNEATVTVLVDENTWNGTWIYSDGKWEPDSDFKKVKY